jgi:hypothetical protein
MGPIGCSKTLGRNYHYSLHKNVERVSQTNTAWQAEKSCGVHNWKFLQDLEVYTLVGHDTITQLSGA